MAPPGTRLDLKHRVRRWHPLRPAIMRSLAQLDHADQETITAYQDRRLQFMVRLAAARSPFYREWFRQSRVDPRSIRTAADLAQLPLLDRSQLATAAGQFLSYPERLMWKAQSSGTTGTPVTCYRTQGSSVFELSILERQWSWFGLSHSPRRVILRGSDFAAGRSGPPTKLLPGAHQLLVRSFGLTPETLPSVVDAIRDFAPDAVEGWPSAIAALASLLHDQGLTVPVAAIITSSEMLTAAQLDVMRTVFRGPIADHYGQTERVAMAGSCEAGGYHVFPDYGIVELLPVPGFGDRWEIVGTALHNWGFPLFRYRTGDHVGPRPSPCPCGRAFPALGRIDGRVSDCFTSADGRPLPMPSIVLADLVDVRESQVAQRQPGRFEVRVVPATDCDLQTLTAQIRKNVDHYYGPGQTVDVRVLDAIPRTASGKLKSTVVDLDNSVTTYTS